MHTTCVDNGADCGDVVVCDGDDDVVAGVGVVDVADVVTDGGLACCRRRHI